MKKVKFVFAVHNHQPVGNFKWVFQKGYDVAYKPFMDVMLKHKKIKWNMHCSGMLWDFFINEHPEYIKSVKNLIKDGNLEIISGGYYEPMLSVIPQRDRIGQIKQLSEFIKNKLKSSVSGAWVAERVWEPSLATDLFQAGIKYTILDDVHFTSVGVDINKLNGYFTTEDQGCKLNIFPISQKLRYFIPFQDVNVTIDYFKKLAQEDKEQVVVLADDGEKFGMWPGTFKHVYENGWLDNFLTALEENSDIVETVTFNEVIEKVKPLDRIYLPTNSYFEMSEWTLPGYIQNDFDSFMKQNEHNEKIKPFIKGSFWRGFLAKYEESNNMHKKMLSVSNKVQKLISKKTKEGPSALQFLYAGQCNCAYWHGVFGGLYLPHLRNAIYENLLKAENIYNDAVNQKSVWQKSDFDCDGNEEFLYESKLQNIYVSTKKGGSIFEFDLLKNNYNMLNVLTRKYEGYHKKLKDAIMNNNVSDSQELTSIHTDAVKVKEIGLENHLYYDWYQKTSLLDHFFHNDTTYDEIYSVKFREQGDFVLGEYEAKINKNSLELTREGKVWFNDLHLPVKVKKVITPLKQGDGYETEYFITNMSDAKQDFTFGTEQVFAFSEYSIQDSTKTEKAKKWARTDDNLKIKVNVESSKEGDFWIVPIYTVSMSENGYERTYQGTTVINTYKFSLEPKKVFRFKIKTLVKNI